MRHQQRGFTIIELMIATTVVSVVLVLVSVIMINIGDLYYKGISQSRVQGNVRSVTDELSQHLQLTSSAPLQVSSPDNSISRLCIGDTSYTYVIGKQISDTQHVLWRDKITPGTCDAPANNFLNTATPTPTGAELISPRSRLVKFQVSPLASPYVINIGVAFGDDDLLCNPSLAPNTCNDEAGGGLNPAEAASGELRCKGKQSDSFCATASLTTTVIQRLN